MVVNVFKSGIFSLKSTEGTVNPGMSAEVSDYLHLEICSPKQILQRLPIALAQVKTGNTSETLLNEIRPIIHSFYQAKNITEKV